MDFWNDPNSAWTHDWANAGKGVDGVLTGLGLKAKQADPNAPGGSLDTTQADEERAKLAPLLAQLQGQAQTGEGAWQQALANSTNQAVGTASALGQANQGAGLLDARHSIGGAQAGAQQRAVGQGNILRAQSQQGAQDQLSQLLSGAQAGDASQGATGAAAQQGINDLNHELATSANKNMENLTGAFGNMFVGKQSKGGPVPGKARVSGDSPKNDTVPTMLSPGEIVIPRSHAGSPEAAAAFVRALMSKKVQHFDGGGQVGDGSGLGGTDNGQTIVPQILLPHIGQMISNNNLNSPQAPSVKNGGLLNTGGYDAARAAQLANMDLIAQRASGAGPSVAPQLIQNATDDAVAAGLGGGKVPLGNLLNRAVSGQQRQASEGVDKSLGEQQQGQAALTHALLNQRAQDAALAAARQQAAFRNTEINAGLDLSKQAALRGVLSGAGQAAVGISNMSGKGGEDSGGTSSMDQPVPDTVVDGGADTNGMDGSYSDQPIPEGNWKGGRIGYSAGGRVSEDQERRATAFLHALRKSKGRAA